MTSEWTPEAIRALGATTDVPTLGDIFGLGRWQSYQMAQKDEWEQVGIRVIKVGKRRYRVVVQSILDVLVISGVPAADDGTEGGAALQEQAPGSAADGALAELPGPAAPESRP